MSKGSRYALILGASYLALSTAAFAQAPSPGAAPKASEATAPSAISEVVVTAQFRAQRVQDTPLSITALNAQTLEARGVTNISTITNTAPGVTLKPLGSSFGPSLGASIRGIGQFDFNPALEPGVGVYVDDVYYPTLTGSDLDLLDLDRVEILRGPQGTLTGRNSIGGAIKLFSKLPNQTTGGYLEAGYGSANAMTLRGAANFALSDVLSMRIAGTFKRQDGFVKQIDYGCAHPGSGVPAIQPVGNCQIGLDGNVDYKGLRSSLRYQPNEKLDVVLSADYTRSDTNPPAEVLTVAGISTAASPNTTANGVPFGAQFECGRYCNYATLGQPAGSWIVPAAFAHIPPFSLLGGAPLSATSTNGQQVLDAKGAGLNGTYKFNDSLSVQSITAYRAYTSTFSSDGDLSPATVQFGINNLNHHFFSQEVRLNGAISDQLKYTIGGYYSDQKTTYASIQDIRYSPAPLQFISNDPVTASSKAAFATVFWTPIPKLNFTGGVRYTSEDKDYTYVRLNFDGTPNATLGALNGTTGSYSGDHFDYRASLDYRWNSAFMTYATVSTGFKGGGVNPRPFNLAQVQPFNQEHLTAFEVGAKTDSFDGRLRVNVSAFFNKYSDIQLTLLSCPQFGGPGPCAMPANVGDADVKGVEVETTARPTDHLTFNGSLSYIDFNYTRIAAATGLTLDSPTIYTPTWKGDVGVQYDFDLAHAGSLAPRLDLSYQDQMYTSGDGPNGIIPAYTLLNAELIWRNTARDLQATLQLSNLTNAYYFLSKLDLTGAGAGTATGTIGRPREVMFTVKKSF